MGPQGCLLLGHTQAAPAKGGGQSTRRRDNHATAGPASGDAATLADAGGRGRQRERRKLGGRVTRTRPPPPPPSSWQSPKTLRRREKSQGGGGVGEKNAGGLGARRKNGGRWPPLPLPPSKMHAPRSPRVHASVWEIDALSPPPSLKSGCSSPCCRRNRPGCRIASAFINSSPAFKRAYKLKVIALAAHRRSAYSSRPRLPSLANNPDSDGFAWCEAEQAWNGSLAPAAATPSPPTRSFPARALVAPPPPVPLAP